MLLVTDLQRQLDDTFMEVYSEEEPEKLEAESKALRQILVKVSELVKEDQKLLSFLRQAVASGPKATQYTSFNVDSFKEVGIYRVRQSSQLNLDLRYLPSLIRIWNAPENGMIQNDNRNGFKKKKDYSEYKQKESNAILENIMKIISSV